MTARQAHPYRDLDVIDARAPRFNQAVIGTLALVAFLTGWWPLLGLLALQFALGLTLGRRWCLPCVAYFELVQPRLGEGPLEDARAPRFANMIGFTVLTAATIANGSGFHTLGWALALLVAALALLAAVTGFCTGCEIYRIGAHLRGIGHGDLRRIDPERRRPHRCRAGRDRGAVHPSAVLGLPHHGAAAARRRPGGRDRGRPQPPRPRPQVRHRHRADGGRRRPRRCRHRPHRA